MTSRVQITFRHVLPSDAVREIVGTKFAKLCSQLPAKARCHVVVDRPTSGSAHNFLVCARVDIYGAGLQICTHGQSADTCRAVRDAFERASAQSQRPSGLRARARPNSALHSTPTSTF